MNFLRVSMHHDVKCANINDDDDENNDDNDNDDDDDDFP